MLFKKALSQDAIEAYLNQSTPKKRSAVLPWVFALGGTGVMLLGALGAPRTFEANQLLELGGSACEAIGIAWLAPAAVRKVFSL